jgi:cell division protein FtsZ
MNEIVVGVGGCGINILNHIKCLKLKNVNLVAVTTNEKKYTQLSVGNKILLGIDTLNGRGTSLDSIKGKTAAMESFGKIQTKLEGANVVIIVAGLAGGTGAGVTPVIVKAAKEMGATVISMVIIPFKFEGRKRMKIALAGLEEIKGKSDFTIVIESEKCFTSPEKDFGIKECFELIDDCICQEINNIYKLLLLFEKKGNGIDGKVIEKILRYRVFENKNRG